MGHLPGHTSEPGDWVGLPAREGGSCSSLPPPPHLVCHWVLVKRKRRVTPDFAFQVKKREDGAKEAERSSQHAGGSIQGLWGNREGRRGFWGRGGLPRAACLGHWVAPEGGAGSVKQPFGSGPGEEFESSHLCPEQFYGIQSGSVTGTPMFAFSHFTKYLSWGAFLKHKSLARSLNR